MTDHVIDPQARDMKPLATRALDTAAKFWFMVAVVGQWIFVYYVLYHYGGLAAQGTFLSSENGGFVADDTFGNLTLILHLSLAVVIIMGGTLQLVPQIRSRFPKFHRWTGRTYISTAIATSIGGLYMLWTRDIPGGTIMYIGMSLDAALIIVFGVLAWWQALKRNFVAHRRWALRLFMVVSAVWFFRVIFMGWVILNGGPAGFDPQTFTGPFVSFLAFGQYLLPLLILEIYLRAKERAGTTGRFAVAGLVSISALLTGFGVFGAVMGMWFPAA